MTLPMRAVVMMRKTNWAPLRMTWESCILAMLFEIVVVVVGDDG